MRQSIVGGYFMEYDNNVIATKSFEFAKRIVNLNKYLASDKKEHVLSRQILKAGTSIGANVSEAERGQTKPDFYSKMAIALKEAHESYYWIRLLHATEYLIEKEFLSLEEDIKEIILAQPFIMNIERFLKILWNMKKMHGNILISGTIIL